MTENTITAVTALPVGYWAVTDDESAEYSLVNVVALALLSDGSVTYLTSDLDRGDGHLLTISEWAESCETTLGGVRIFTSGEQLPVDNSESERDDAPESFTGSLR
jgi:hypothetical protein